MPGFDGTGPRGEGPLTGRGEGYCVLQLPDPASGKPAFGFAGLAGVPVWLYPRLGGALPICQPLLGFYPGRWIGYSRGLHMGRRHGRRFFMRGW
ncbi:MAG: DUF5320 domain-containing protein [Chloroflexi bacterium]|nr:DUF5320 domain-containing protein [Chloroflexota bacterium]